MLYKKILTRPSLILYALPKWMYMAVYGKVLPGPTPILSVTVRVDCDGYFDTTTHPQKHRHNRHKPSRRLKTQAHLPPCMTPLPAIADTIFI